MTAGSSQRRRTATAMALALGLGVGALAVLQEPAANAALSASVGPFQLAWTHVLSDPTRPIAGSSPSVATLDSRGPSVIVGDRAGFIYAYHLSDGSPVAGWPVSTGGVAIDSTASVTGTGPAARVFVGVGNSATPANGGYLKLTASGRPVWFKTPKALPEGGTAGVQASMAIGTLQGQLAVIAGPMGQEKYALSASTGRVLPGFPWYQADTTFSTPALADLYGTGQQMIIEGGDSTAGISYNKRYTNGGHLRILSPTGNGGNQADPGAGLFCSFDTDQVVQSSPAVGRTLARGRTGITFGTGTFYPTATSTNQLITLDDRCHKAWVANLDGATPSSPALADNMGTGELNVIEATRTGGVYALRGSTGQTIWHAKVPGQVFGSVATVSLNGKYQDVLVPSTAGLYVLDGRSGKVLYRSWDGMALQNTPLVTVEADGTVGLTLAGYRLRAGDRKLVGAIQHFSIKGAPAANVSAKGSWPMFHHDTYLSGNASLAQASGSGLAPALSRGVSAAPPLLPERGAAKTRHCQGDVCVIPAVQGRTTTGLTNFGANGVGYGEVTVDPASPGRAAVAAVRVDSVVFGTPAGWLTHTSSSVQGRAKAAAVTKPVPWRGGSSRLYRVQVRYTVIRKDGTRFSGVYAGPYFRGFHS